VLLGITVSLVALGSYVIGGSQYTTVSGRSFSNRPVRLGAFRWLAFAIVAAFLVVSLVLPLIFLVQNSVINQFGLNPLNPVNYSLRHWDSVFSLEQPRKSIANTFILAIGAATIGVALYTLVAYVIVRGRFRAKRLLDMVVWIPGAVPTLVLGMAILWTILPSPLGALYGSLALLILAHVIRGLPGETRLMVSTIVQISGELEESARVHGVSWLRTYTAIWLPLLKPGLVTAWTFTFVIAFYDLSLVVFLYGPNSTVLPTLFLSLWRGGQIEKASVAALIMVTMIFVVVTIVRRFSRSGLPSTPET
jgi:iron(III) transport system permease protein